MVSRDGPYQGEMPGHGQYLVPDARNIRFELKSRLRSISLRSRARGTSLFGTYPDSVAPQKSVTTAAVPTDTSEEIDRPRQPSRLICEEAGSIAMACDIRSFSSV